MNKNTENGIKLANTDVVAVDVIARLAGVTGRDVCKVLTALHVLKQTSNIELAALTNIESMPSHPASPASERYDNTACFVGSLIHKLQKPQYRHMLHYLEHLGVRRRFTANGEPRGRHLKVVGA